MSFGEMIGGTFSLFALSYLIVHFGEFFHRRNQNMTTVFLMMGGIFVFLFAAAGIGAILGFTG